MCNVKLFFAMHTLKSVALQAASSLKLSKRVGLKRQRNSFVPNDLCGYARPCLILFSVLLTIAAGSSNAEPLITKIENKKLSEGSIVTGKFIVRGSSFDPKEQAPAVLYDIADRAWENGILNTHHQSFSDMQRVERPNVDPNTLWAKPSLPSSDDPNAPTGVLVAKSRPTRDERPGAQYYAARGNNFLGWPTAYGGGSVTSEARKMYVAWWIKTPFDLANYWAIPANQNSDKFITGGAEEYGESIVIEGIPGEGKIISYEPDLGALDDGWIFFEAPEGASKNEMKNRKITGTTSGTTITFPGEFANRAFDKEGYLLPRGKYARFWSNPRGDGFRFSLGNDSFSAPGSATPNVFTSKFGSRSPEPGKWNFFEVSFDKGKESEGRDPSLLVRLNGQIYVKAEQDWKDGLKEVVAENNLQDEKAVTIALLGINDFMVKPFSFDIDDIYFDNTFQRVMVCDKPTIESIYSGDGHCELQRITSWNAGSIEFDIHLGALRGFTGRLYVYVFDENGVPNTDGVLLAAPNPPSVVTN